MSSQETSYFLVVFPVVLALSDWDRLLANFKVAMARDGLTVDEFVDNEVDRAITLGCEGRDHFEGFVTHQRGANWQAAMERFFNDRSLDVEIRS